MKNLLTVVFCLALLGCHTPTPPTPPPMHGVIVSLLPGDSRPVDHYVIFRGASCASLASFVITSAQQYIDKSAIPGQPYCYAAEEFLADGSSSGRSVGVSVVWAATLEDCVDCVARR